MLRVVNFILVIGILVNAIYIINQRFNARQNYMQISVLQNKASNLNKEYTRLQLEEGTYSSGLAVQDFAATNLGLVQPDKLHIVELK